MRKSICTIVLGLGATSSSQTSEESKAIVSRAKGNSCTLGKEKNIAGLGLNDNSSLILHAEVTLNDNLHFVVSVGVNKGFTLFLTVESRGKLLAGLGLRVDDITKEGVGTRDQRRLLILTFGDGNVLKRHCN